MKEIEDDKTDGKIYHVLGLEESIWLKLTYYPRQSTDSVQSLSNYQWYFSHKNNNNNNKLKMCIETQNILSSQSKL